MEDKFLQELQMRGFECRTDRPIKCKVTIQKGSNAFDLGVLETKDPLIKLSVLDPQWISVFCRLVEYIEAKAFSFGDSVIEERQKELLAEWHIGIHFLWKESFNSRHKIPIRLRKETRGYFEAKGKLLASIKNLCVNLHSDLPIFKTASVWFEAILKELIESSLKIELDDFSTSGESPLLGKGLLGHLRQKEELHDLLDERKFARLIDLAMDSASKYPNFDRDFWKPFIYTYSQFFKLQKSNGTRIALFNGKLVPVNQGTHRREYPLGKPSGQKCDR